jgi:hypothetical protein
MGTECLIRVDRFRGLSPSQPRRMATPVKSAMRFVIFIEKLVS